MEKHVGCPSCDGGRTFAIGDGSWRSAPIERVAEYSPLVALARVERCAFVPWLTNLRATFNDSTVTTTQPTTWGTGGTPTVPQFTPSQLNQFIIVDAIRVQVLQQNSFTGQVFKNESDFFFSFQSGIEANCMVDGQPKYVPSTDFTPIAALAELLCAGWPMGWVLVPSQMVRMQFNATLPLPSFPTRVTMTFRSWTPAPMYGDRYIQMTEGAAAKILGEKYGLDPYAGMPCRSDRPNNP